MRYIVTHYNWNDTGIIESSFNYWYQAQQLADSLGFRFISIRSERENGCSCIDFDSESHAACKLHGISAQLNRSQME